MGVSILVSSGQGVDKARTGGVEAVNCWFLGQIAQAITSEIGMVSAGLSERREYGTPSIRERC